MNWKKASLVSGETIPGTGDQIIAEWIELQSIYVYI